MTATSPELFDDTLFKAARFRVAGLNWHSVGQELHVDAQTLERQSFAEKPRWKQLVREAEKDMFHSVGWECLNMLRFLIRDDKREIRLKAVDIYMRFWNGIIRHRPKGGRKTGDPFEMPYLALDESPADVCVVPTAAIQS